MLAEGVSEDEGVLTLVVGAHVCGLVDVGTNESSLANVTNVQEGSMRGSIKTPPKLSLSFEPWDSDSLRSGVGGHTGGGKGGGRVGTIQYFPMAASLHTCGVSSLVS